MQLEKAEPLVTVGIPTYNRAAGLQRTLQAICSQSYRSLQIIVSDNASTDPRVEKVVRDVMTVDGRVAYHRHPTNLGVMANFSSLIAKGTGEYFMWAADDDRWQPFFIERCVAGHLEDPSLSVCQMEAQYELPTGELFPMFREGAAFYDAPSGSKADCLGHLLRNVYGNLVYGVFRTSALFHEGRPVTDWIGTTLNEIPMLALVASKGGIRVIPEIGMFKTAPKQVCEQARWEQLGGWHPTWPGIRGWWAALGATRQYHDAVRDEVVRAIDTLDDDDAAKQTLRDLITSRLRQHERSLGLRWKPRAASGLSEISN